MIEIHNGALVVSGAIVLPPKPNELGVCDTFP